MAILLYFPPNYLFNHKPPAQNSVALDWHKLRDGDNRFSGMKAILIIINYVIMTSLETGANNGLE